MNDKAKKALIAFSVVVIMVLAYFVYGWLSIPTKWEREIVVTPYYPVTYHTITSEGRCNTSWFLRVIGYESKDADGRCLAWTPIEGWNESNLEIRYASNLETVQKPKGSYGPALPAVVDIRTTDKTNRVIKIQYECPCRK